MRVRPLQEWSAFCSFLISLNDRVDVIRLQGLDR
jgi:hypothetical protein